MNNPILATPTVMAHCSSVNGTTWKALAKNGMYGRIKVKAILAKTANTKNLFLNASLPIFHIERVSDRQFQITNNSNKADWIKFMVIATL